METDRDVSFAYNGLQRVIVDLINSGQRVCFSPAAAEEWWSNNKDREKGYTMRRKYENFTTMRNDAQRKM